MDDEQVFYEDIEPDRVVECGSHTVTKPEMIAFAEQYDPLPFHVDETAAEQTAHEGLIASGWHTVVLAHRLIVDELRTDLAVVAGVQVDDVTWPEPVRPDDTLTVRVEALEKRPSESDPGRGIVTQEVVVVNQHDRVVLSYRETMLVERRRDG